MMLVKILLITALVLICFQDVKQRKVYWFLFPLFGLCAAVLFFKNALSEAVYSYLGWNTLIIIIMLSVVILYSKLKLKARLQDVFGLGDVLFFLALIFTFATISFLYVFVFSLGFSLLLHLMVKPKISNTTVPLAGYMSLCYVVAYSLHWSGFSEYIYLI